MGTGTIVTIVILVALVIVVISIYNNIIGGSNRAQRAWADVLTYERQKTKVLDAVMEQAASFKDYEKQLLEKVTALRSAISDLPAQADGNALKGVESGTRDLLQGLKIAVEAYPDLKAVQVVNNLMREISEQQANVSAAITIFNRNVESFNNSIQMFPGSVVNGVLNHKSPIAPFSDAAASAGFDYTPNF